MMSPTHLIGGFVITGTFASLAGENILQTKTAIVCTLVCSLLPDIDLPKSPISWLILPISRWINTHWGHRTYTHTIWALMIVCFFAWLFHLPIIVCGTAFASHLLLDSMTKSGVALLYPIFPLHEKIAVLPSNPNLRFTTGEPKTEILVSSVFLALSLLLYPLMQDGFWTTFNRSFGMPKTLYSEFIKSSDLLNVSYEIQEGSELKTGNGYLLACEREDCFQLWRNDSTFFRLDAQSQIVKSVVPGHSHKRFTFEDMHFVGIGADSLNRLLRGKVICELKVNANEPFRIWVNGVPSEKSQAEVKYANRVSVNTLDSLPSKDDLFGNMDFESLRLQNELTRLQDEYTFKLSEYSRHIDSLQKYDNLARQETNPIAKEKFQKRRDEIHLPDKPVKDWVSEKALKAALDLSQKKFQFEQRKKLFEVENSYKKELSKVKETVFVGYLKIAKIE